MPTKNVTSVLKAGSKDATLTLEEMEAQLAELTEAIEEKRLEAEAEADKVKLQEASSALLAFLNDEGDAPSRKQVSLILSTLPASSRPTGTATKRTGSGKPRVSVDPDKVLKALPTDPFKASTLAERLGISAPTATNHLKRLEAEGIVGKTGKKDSSGKGQPATLWAKL